MLKEVNSSGDANNIDATRETLATDFMGFAFPTSAPEKLVPPVSVRKSITPDHLISLEDGRQYRTLKRHLTRLGLTPDQYRTKWRLPADYPMVAPNYSKQRSEMAHKIGLGRKAAAEKPTKAAAKSRGTGGRKRSRKG